MIRSLSGLLVVMAISGCVLSDLQKKTEHRLEEILSDPNATQQVAAPPVQPRAKDNAQCRNLSELFKGGEYKKVVELADELKRSGQGCSGESRKQIRVSRTRLEQANAYVRKANSQKDQGELLLARQNLKQALEVYPNYYWVQHLLQNIDECLEKRVTDLRNRAGRLQDAGELEASLAMLEKARELSPGDKGIERKIARLEERMVLVEQEKSLLQCIKRQRIPHDTICLGQARKILADEIAATPLARGMDEPMARVDDRHQLLAREVLQKARDQEQDGDLDAATGQTMCLFVLGLSLENEKLRADIVEFARLLGMKQFSAGNFSLARDLWQGGLTLDPENKRLKKYLHEVESGLHNLKKIKLEEEWLES